MRWRERRLREIAMAGPAFSRCWHAQAWRARERAAQKGDRRKGLLQIAEQYDDLLEQAPRRRLGLQAPREQGAR
jgi:hypothetical protein